MNVLELVVLILLEKLSNHGPQDFRFMHLSFCAFDYLFFVYLINCRLPFVACCWVLQTVVFCLVDIYIMLGKAFVPYLEGLNSTQLRLVTIYANRISQARTGTTIDANQ